MVHTAKKLLLFDIDGTLLRCGGSPSRAFEAAFEHLFEVPQAWGKINAHGRTDPSIIEEICEMHLNRRLSSEEFHLLCGEYIARLAVEIESDELFRTLPGVVELVQRLAADQNCCLGLQTGNLEPAGRLKLKRGKLHTYFDFGGFGSDHILRPEIVRTAIARAEERLGRSFDPENIFVIGDTVHDIQAGKAVGAATIAVATGKSSAEVLADAGPDLMVMTLEDPRVEKIFSR